MNIMNRTAWKAMWRNKLRTWVTVAGIILSAAMFMAVTTMCVSIWQFLVDHERISNGDYFVKIINHSQDQLDILQNDEHITKLGIGKTLGYSTFSLSTENGNISETAVILSGDQAFFEMLSDELIRGVYPKNSNEIAITENIYQYLKQEDPVRLVRRLPWILLLSWKVWNFLQPGKPIPKNIRSLAFCRPFLNIMVIISTKAVC